MIKLASPDIDVEEFEEVRKVLESKFLVQGDKVEQLENLICDYLNINYAIAVSSGTAALHLALLALDIISGDEIIVPDFTFPATANVVECVGANVKLIDIKKNDFCIDESDIERNITEKTKVIIPVQEFGNSCDMEKIINIAKRYNLKVVEDAACALGAEYDGKKVGTIGDIGCFSLHPRKTITTGEGGIVVTNNATIAKKIKILRNHGIEVINGKTTFVEAGFNYRMTNIQGAIGVAQFKKLEKLNAIRRSIAVKYNQLLKNINGITLPMESKNVKHVWQTYHILLDDCIDRNIVIKKLKEKGIESNFGAYSVHSQPYYKNKYKLNSDYYINSTKCYTNGLALPLHSNLKDEELEYIKEMLEEVINEFYN
ncbi:MULTISPECIES: DegT/DnrJ/EryC1/StrS family aminotransferase [Clostridium]|uniref:DegT/DnrJ/EryC1/StrS family aminotransferase n=1 Tax=Clostridium TaxID=1485 RepID=UPI00129A4648|nr:MULTISPECIES: DegT/DnrJ/EryC1/StrS family aminotransferase [Clostridium]MDU1068725.1 DegT/DnrJ/EryC1/StrS family aminotransferase [Clostridium sp.]MDU1336968.1 DegT/DnrJ/EryC1/StrS family aminotransferase [Clostridium butyricum]MDU2676309.1 DegT/DnrJ/EryC1/StrS family aminotransferase [Clostridium sp.]MDU4210654.1 DegT/DnrJ/EryC1/StrS family aminotransferase [Clostridium sp.]MDU5173914.1 DegT/DnrJ/EryC1/StrS family aminotransferase [Clostridium sp.]